MNKYGKIGVAGAISAALMIATITPALAANSAASRMNGIDRCVAALNYNPVLTIEQKGEGASNLPPTTGSLKNGEYTVVTRTKKKLDSAQGDFSAAGLNANEIYPGSLVKVDHSLMDNRPTVLRVRRTGKLTISADLPGYYGSYENVKRPNGATVNNAIGKILNNWNTTAGLSYKNQASRIVFTESMVNSKQQFEAQFSGAFKVRLADLGIDFNAVSKGEKQLYVASLRQVFYTVSANPPSKPSDWVANNRVSRNRLCNNDPKSGPGYISSVDYGRQIYVFAQTSSKDNDVKAAFSAAFKDQNVKLNSHYAQVLNNSDIKAMVFGGSAADHVKVTSGNVDQIRAVINEGATYSVTNPAAPVSYTVKYLKDNSYATANTVGEYYDTKVQTYKQGRLTINHRGAYVAQYHITWQEITGFDANGNPIMVDREWENNWHSRTSGASDQILLPANARNISIYVREATGLFWDWWRTVVFERNLPLVPDRTINIWGSTLRPGHDMQ